MIPATTKLAKHASPASSGASATDTTTRTAGPADPSASSRHSGGDRPGGGGIDCSCGGSAGAGGRARGSGTSLGDIASMVSEYETSYETFTNPRAADRRRRIHTGSILEALFVTGQVSAA